ncbi:MAG: Threonine-tRNA ligase [Candidatus Daviesbacteria bacterium GW2011_GWB1_41_5]|uniref:Threonine--tRNA ligase n=1 Tax=Candidatus Daviesbacteria bacterium GW2011_GWB1_41_5 TaxID=1618429 RepID=A0A0G0WNH5_9BACT|nr:MAG: Threonine-tRNA ligase [Candidatus Daviesbacteria bacterium GW2011_GWB1_41_5]HIH13928.1 threonine--tRNA ligase [Nanoarchaeota archaeon]
MEKAPFVSEAEKRAFWHSTSHILADAVKRLWPEVKLGIGPAIDEGFYYDFSKKEPFTEADLAKIESVMKKITKEGKLYKEVFMTRKEAEKFLAKEPYKLDLLKEIPDKQVSFHQHGSFIDMCNTPVVKSTGQIKAFKLLNLAAAYWRGDSTKPQLQRIYGISFPDKEQLDEYLKLRDEAEKRNHRILGLQHELFMFHETAPGMPYWLPKGMVILNELINFWRQEHAKRGYKEISTPLINKKELWEKSGHWEHYRNDMFIVDLGPNEIYGVKAMNCPNAMIVFGSRARSYRELPLRFSNTDILHRYEASGALNGLLRVREFRQDDSHNFISEDQIEQEYDSIFEIAELFYGIFGLKYKLRLSTRPEKFMGDIKAWNEAEAALKRILEKRAGKGNYSIADGDGAFYGPKIDILMTDALGREWQMGTVQLDFQQPKRFNLKYIDKENKERTPIVVHRVIYGSLERFIGILIENFAGAFPLWLSPVQVKILSFTDRNIPACQRIEKELFGAGFRVESDYGNNTVDYKVRAAELEKVPYVLVVGDKEEKNNTVAVRKRGTAKVQFGVTVQNFIGRVIGEIEKKV